MSDSNLPNQDKEANPDSKMGREDWIEFIVVFILFLLTVIFSVINVIL